MIPAKVTHGEKNSKEAEYLAGWKRARAELDNIRKRMDKERLHQNEQLKRHLVESLLEVADNFSAIVEHAPQEQDSWTQGVVHVARQLEAVLQGFGVEKMGSVGEIFDLAIHEAIGEEKSETVDPGHIVQVIRPGYRIGETVIRPARVKISS